MQKVFQNFCQQVMFSKPYSETARTKTFEIFTRDGEIIKKTQSMQKILFAKNQHDRFFKMTAVRCPDAKYRFLTVSFFHFSYVFWSDWGLHAYIARAGLDGTSSQPIITTQIGWPNALTIDYVTERLYWGDALVNIIE